MTTGKFVPLDSYREYPPEEMQQDAALLKADYVVIAKAGHLSPLESPSERCSSAEHYSAGRHRCSICQP